MNTDNFTFWYGQEALALLQMSEHFFDSVEFEAARQRFEFARNRARKELDILLSLLNENTRASTSQETGKILGYENTN